MPRPFVQVPDAFVPCSVLSSLSSSITRILVIGTLLGVVAACGSSGEVEKLRTENERLRQQLEEARAEAASLQRGETIKTLSTDIYFKSGSAELTQRGVEELKGVARRLKTAYDDRTIRIEGYTDSRPIGDQLDDRFPSNWELSAARAARVARHFRWTHDMDPTRFEVVGFGPHHPVATNETAAGRRKNRRVRVAVLASSPSPDEDG
jgi:chemotaxis protein MotB